VKHYAADIETALTACGSEAHALVGVAEVRLIARAILAGAAREDDLRVLAVWVLGQGVTPDELARFYVERR
jgi:hypothetical protein